MRYLRRLLWCVRNGKEIIKNTIAVDYELLGSDYGGWAVMLDNLHSNSIVYSFGVGNDISFDQAVVAHRDCDVYLFDPTYGVKDWFDKINNSNKLKFSTFGLWDKDEKTYFYKPINANHVSCSAIDESPESGRYQVDMKCLKTIMKENGHRQIDLLKMDIEGAEFRVIDDMLACQLFPQQWLIEFHHGYYGIDYDATVSSIRKLCASGYEIFHVSHSGHEISFLRR